MVVKKKVAEEQARRQAEAKQKAEAAPAQGGCWSAWPWNQQPADTAPAQPPPPPPPPLPPLPQVGAGAPPAHQAAPLPDVRELARLQVKHAEANAETAKAIAQEAEVRQRELEFRQQQEVQKQMHMERVKQQKDKEAAAVRASDFQTMVADIETNLSDDENAKDESAGDENDDDPEVPEVPKTDTQSKGSRGKGKGNGPKGGRAHYGKAAKHRYKMRKNEVRWADVMEKEKDCGGGILGLESL